MLKLKRFTIDLFIIAMVFCLNAGWPMIEAHACEPGNFSTMTSNHTNNLGENCQGNGILDYETLQMNINETQNLSVTGNTDNGQCYNWEIVSGGGDLSASKGLAVTYTAPDTNPSCNQNPTIRLTSGSKTQEITVAVNAVTTGGYSAYVTWDGSWSAHWCVTSNCGENEDLCSPPDRCHLQGDVRAKRKAYSCNGEDKGDTLEQNYEWINAYFCVSDLTCESWLPEAEATVTQEMADDGWGLGVVEDVRAPWLKEAGCCPAALK